MAYPCDVSRPEDLHRLETAVRDRFGHIDILMNNAGIQPGTKLLDPDNWPRTLDVNLWGVIRGTQTFAPGMIAQGTPGLIINTGSKQGITTPPGDPAYNVSKAGVKVFTEALQHQLRNHRELQDRGTSAHPRICFHPAGRPRAYRKARRRMDRRSNR